MSKTRKIVSCLFITAILILATAIIETASAAQSASSMRQQMQAMANDPANADHAAHFQNAAEAAGRAVAALNENPPNQEKAAGELKDALRVLVDAAWNGADVEAIAMQIGGALLEMGAFNEHGLEQLQGLLALLAEANRLQASSSGASLEQSMAIRELVIALNSVIDTGWHDFWHSIKALRWYINAAASGVNFDDMISRLLAFVDSGDFSAEAAANIVQMIENLVQGIKDGTISGGSVKESLDRIRDAISDETRRIANDRRERNRQQAEADDRAETEAARATASRYGDTDTTLYGPTVFGPYIRDIDSDNWKAGTTPPIRPPEIVWQVPAGPQGPTAPVAPAPVAPAPVAPIPVAPTPAPVPTGSPIGPEPMGPIGPEPIGPMGPGVTPPPPPAPPSPSGPPPGPSPMMGPF